jgi:uncharacterized protein YraI
MKSLLCLTLLAILLSACSTAPTSTARPTKVLPTKTSRPTSTPTRKPVTLTACVTNSTIRIRKGPGTDYEVIGGLVSGTCMSIKGRNRDSSWVYMVSEDGKTGWVAASLLTIEGNLSRVSLKSNTVDLSLAPTSKVIPTSTRKPVVFATNTPRTAVIQPTVQGNNCSPAYPGVCIPPRPPDLDCPDIPYRRFTVLSPDPHDFDRDGDGVGCES